MARGNGGGSSDRRAKALPVAVVSITSFALVTFLVLIVWTAASSGGDLFAGGEGEGIKVLLNLVVLFAAVASLLVHAKRGFRPSSEDDDGGPRDRYDKFHLGILAAATCSVGGMLTASFGRWVTFEFGGETILRAVVAYACLLLSPAFFGVSYLIYREGKGLPETGQLGDGRDAEAKSAAHLEMLGQIWTLLSTGTVASISALLVAVLILSIGEEGRRFRMEGGLNLIFVLALVVAAAAALSTWGRKMLAGKSDLGSLGVGMLYGGAMYFALLLFLLFLLCSNLTGEERREGNEVWVQRGVSFALFFLSVMYLAFAMGVHRYKQSILEAITERDPFGGLKRMFFGGSGKR